MTSHEQVKRYWRVAFLLWLSVVTIATHLPQGDVGESVFESPDKLLHMVCFGMLAFMWMCTGWIRSRWKIWVLMALWAVVDEITQDALQINRPFSNADLLASELGIASAILWFHSLQSEPVAHIRDAVEHVLARFFNWWVLGVVAFITTLVCSALLWFVSVYLIGTQSNGLALLIGIVFGTVSVLYCVIRMGELQSEIASWKKSMVPTLFATIVIASMFGFISVHTTIDPWVVALTLLVVGSRVAWNRAVSMQEVQ